MIEFHNFYDFIPSSSSLHDEDDTRLSMKELHEGLIVPNVQDELWYIVERNWFNAFKNFQGLVDDGNSSSVYPGPIDNTPILNVSKKNIMIDLKEGQEFVVVSPALWNLIFHRFGLKEDQNPIHKKMLSSRSSQKGLRDKMYKVTLNLNDDTFLNKKIMTHEFSGSDRIGEMVQELQL